MIGTIGFLIGSAAIGCFAATARRAYRFADPRKLRLFCMAFGLFAVAMLVWAFAAAAGDDTTVVTRLLFCSDVLLLAGTIAMSGTLVPRSSVLVNICAVTIGAFVLTLRAFAYPPAGYVQHGVLYFNLTGNVRLVFLLAFVAVWLPAMVYMSFSVTNDPLLAGIKMALTASFTALIGSAVLFLAARRAGVIMTLFVTIIVLFLVMSAINLLIAAAHRAARPKRKAHRAPAN